MNLAPLDVALLGGVALVVGIGLFRGLSGELASFLGFVAAVVAGYCLYGFVHAGLRAVGFNKGDTTELVATGVAVFIIAIVAFGLTWRIVNKFISFLVPQPTNALLGAPGHVRAGGIDQAVAGDPHDCRVGGQILRKPL